MGSYHGGIRRTWAARLAAAVLVAAAPILSWADSPRTVQVELTCGAEVFRGRVLAHNAQEVWLELASGRLKQVAAGDVASFRKTDEPFRPISAAELASQLREELGSAFEVRITGRSVVAARQGTARTYAALIDETARAFEHYTSVRGLSAARDFPLAAVVFPNRESFAHAAKADGVTVSSTLRGYYHPVSNRVLLFEETAETAQGMNGADRHQLFAMSAQGTISGSLHDTIVHEATHQLAFNAGLHHRIGPTPTWVAEGLATLFEVDAVRESGPQVTRARRVHAARLAAYRDGRRRAPKATLHDFIARDDMFQTMPVEAYGEAWALSFYLSETRGREYVAYLRAVARRPPLEKYTAEQRLSDFHTVSGPDLRQFEAGYRRFIDGLGGS